MAILVFGKITWAFNRITNHLFYREAYSSRVALGKLTDALVSHIELPQLIKTSRKVLTQTLKPVHGTIVIYGAKNRMLGDPPQRIEKTLNQVLPARSRIASGRFINVDSTSNKNAEYMRRGGIQLIVPIHTTKNLEGCIVLGPRSSGEVYSKQDLDFLKIAARNIGLAVNNAKSYQQISEFNKTLSAKVKKATSELRVKNHELENLHKTKDDFISMASHQLRPKITASQGFLDLLNKSDLKKTKDQAELFDLASQGIKRMGDIVIDMLDISRMDADHIALEYGEQPVNLIELVESEIFEVMGSKNSKRFELRTRPKVSKLWMHVDTVKLREVVNNLLSNADQYSPKDAVVAVQISRSKEHVEVIVVDKGFGLTKGEQKRLFEKFYRSDEAKRIRPTGSGVGLYISKKIIDAHGGKMIVKSEPGKGTSIGFSLPLKP